MALFAGSIQPELGQIAAAAALAAVAEAVVVVAHRYLMLEQQSQDAWWKVLTMSSIRWLGS